jgi:hypothetical protein
MAGRAADTARAFYAVRRGGPTTFTPQVKRDMSSFDEDDDDRVRPRKVDRAASVAGSRIPGLRDGRRYAAYRAVVVPAVPIQESTEIGGKARLLTRHDSGDFSQAYDLSSGRQMRAVRRCERVEIQRKHGHIVVEAEQDGRWSARCATRRRRQRLAKHPRRVSGVEQDAGGVGHDHLTRWIRETFRNPVRVGSLRHGAIQRHSSERQHAPTDEFQRLIRELSHALMV